MIEEGVVALTGNNVILYTSSGSTTLGYGIMTLAMLGRRALARKGATYFLKEDVVKSPWESLPFLGGELLGVAFGRFISGGRHFASASIDGRSWYIIKNKYDAEWSIVNDALTYYSCTETGYSFDGIRWYTLPTNSRIVCVGPGLVLTVEFPVSRELFTLYKNGITVYDYAEYLPLSVVSWHNRPVTLFIENIVLFHERGCRKLPIPTSSFEALSNNFMVVIRSKDTTYVTTDLQNFREISGDVAIIDGKVISLRPDGYEVLHAPTAFERILGNLQKSRMVLACLLRKGIPFHLFYLIM